MAVDFGTDVSTYPVFDVTGRTITGVRVIAECSLRRLTTKQGTLEYDPDFGLDLSECLNDDFDDADLRSLSADAERQLELDERILTASVSITLDPATMHLRIRVTGTLVDSRPFKFVLAISDVSASVLEVT